MGEYQACKKSRMLDPDRCMVLGVEFFDRKDGNATGVG